MSSSDVSPDIPRTSDGAPNWAADTDPVGPVTPELALVDPGLTRGEINHEETMSSMQFGDGTTLGVDPAQAPAEAQPLAPLQPIDPVQPVASVQPVEPIQPIQPLQPLNPLSAEPVPAAPLEPAPVAPAPPAVAPDAPMAIADMRDVPLGTLVFRAGLLPEERLEEALQEGMKTGKRLGEILLERAWVSEDDLGRLLAGQKGLPFVDLDPAAIDPSAPALLHPDKARLHGAIPVGFESGVPVVAVADPSNDLVVENVRRALSCEPVLVVAGRDALHRAINHFYGAEAVELQQPAPTPAAEPAPVAPEPVVEPQPAAVVEVPAPVYGPPTVEPVPLAVEPVAVQPTQNGEGLWLGGQPDSVQPAPVAQPEPVQQPEPVAQQPEVAVQPEPVHQVEPVQLPAPVVQPEPIQVEPVQQVEVQPQQLATPEPPMPAPSASPPQPEPETSLSWAVVLRLTNDERLELGAFPGEAEALERARGVVAQVSANDGWPFVAGRFIRPDAIVSVDLVELEQSKWLGSSARAAAWSPAHAAPAAPAAPPAPLSG